MYGQCASGVVRCEKMLYGVGSCCTVCESVVRCVRGRTVPYIRNVEPRRVGWQELNSMACALNRLNDPLCVMKRGIVEDKRLLLAGEEGEDGLTEEVGQRGSVPGTYLNLACLYAIAVDGSHEREVGTPVVGAVPLCSPFTDWGTAEVASLLEVEAGFVEEDGFVEGKALGTE